MHWSLLPSASECVFVWRLNLYRSNQVRRREESQTSVCLVSWYKAKATRGEHYVKRKAEIWMMLLWAKDCQGLPANYQKLERRGADTSAQLLDWTEQAHKPEMTSYGFNVRDSRWFWGGLTQCLSSNPFLVAVKLHKASQILSVKVQVPNKWRGWTTPAYVPNLLQWVVFNDNHSCKGPG